MKGLHTGSKDEKFNAQNGTHLQMLRSPPEMFGELKDLRRLSMALTVSQVEKTLDKREVPVGQAMRGTHLHR